MALNGSETDNPAGADATSTTVAGSLLDSFLRYKKNLSRVVGRIVRPEEIEDIVQETFVLSFVASRDRQLRNPQAFMVRVAKNIALDHIKRAENRLNCSLDDLDTNELLAAYADMPEVRCQSEERFLAFCRAVAELPVSCRRVFILKKVYGLSLVEISGRLGISQSTVEKHVAKGMFMVIEYMLQRGHDTSVAEEPQGMTYSAGVKNLD
jgi:RNA polymerase sigma-70 factor (ECF subfamily)